MWSIQSPIILHEVHHTYLNILTSSLYFILLFATHDSAEWRSTIWYIFYCLCSFTLLSISFQWFKIMFSFSLAIVVVLMVSYLNLSSKVLDCFLEQISLTDVIVQIWLEEGWPQKQKIIEQLDCSQKFLFWISCKQYPVENWNPWPDTKLKKGI